MKATKEQVRAAIADERRYQDVKWPMHDHSVGEWVMLANYYARKIPFGVVQDMHTHRKLAAIIVACMEQRAHMSQGEAIIELLRLAENVEIQYFGMEGITAIHLSNNAIDAWVKNPGDEAAINRLWDLGSYIVACMHWHGAARRELPFAA